MVREAVLITWRGVSPPNLSCCCCQCRVQLAESDLQFDNSFLSMSIVCVVEAGNGWLGAAVAQEVLSRTLLDGKPIAATIVFHAYGPAELAQLAGLTNGTRCDLGGGRRHSRCAGGGPRKWLRNHVPM